MKLRLLILLSSLLSSLPGVEQLDFFWPTPGSTQSDQRRPAEVLQPTASGDPDSGGFGCVRSNGHRFHEGIDIKPQRVDRRGEPLDDICAAMNGVVRHINHAAGDSSYGRYIVLEHPDMSPAVYTLYAHLAGIAPGLRSGDRVRGGQIIATMGHTSGGYSIPRDRAHLHFEIGLVLTREFQSWYIGKHFGSPNQHNLYNGMNLMGIDPWEFVRRWRAGNAGSFDSYFSRLESAVKLRIATTRVPDFVQRYPTLQAGQRPEGVLGGWEVCVDVTGLPFRWTPLDTRQVAGMRHGEILIVDANDELLRHHRCKDLLVTRRGRREPGKDLNTVLDLLFSLH